MNTKSNSIRKKTFIYLLSYSAIILLLLWLFQIVFLKIFFERYQYNKIIEVASKISENNLENLEEEIYNNDMSLKFIMEIKYMVTILKIKTVY